MSVLILMMGSGWRANVAMIVGRLLEFCFREALILWRMLDICGSVDSRPSMCLWKASDRCFGG